MPLKMPRIPAPEGFHFKDVAGHQLRRALAKEIRETIKILCKSVCVPGYPSTLQKYLAVIEPGAVKDPARLPVPSSGPWDMGGKTNIGCVYARLGWVIQLYWELCLNGANNTRDIRKYLADLRAWAAAGIDKCAHVGSSREGWTLEVTPCKT